MSNPGTDDRHFFGAKIVINEDHDGKKEFHDCYVEKIELHNFRDQDELYVCLSSYNCACCLRSITPTQNGKGKKVYAYRCIHPSHKGRDRFTAGPEPIDSVSQSKFEWLHLKCHQNPQATIRCSNCFNDPEDAGCRRRHCGTFGNCRAENVFKLDEKEVNAHFNRVRRESEHLVKADRERAMCGAGCSFLANCEWMQYNSEASSITGYAGSDNSRSEGDGDDSAEHSGEGEVLDGDGNYQPEDSGEAGSGGDGEDSQAEFSGERED